MFLVVWERRIAFLVGVVQVAVQQLFVKGVMDGVNEVLLGALCAERYAQWFEEEERPGVDWRWSSWLRGIGVAANSASVSGESVASMSDGMTDRQAVHGVVACRCSAEPTPKPPCEAGGDHWG